MKWHSREMSTILAFIILIGLYSATNQPVYSLNSEQNFFSQDLSSDLLKQSGDFTNSQESKGSISNSDQNVPSQGEPIQDASIQDLSSELLESSGDTSITQESQASTLPLDQIDQGGIPQDLSLQSVPLSDKLPSAPLQDQLLLDLLSDSSTSATAASFQDQSSLVSTPASAPASGFTSTSGFAPTSGFTSTSVFQSDPYATRVSQPTSLTTPVVAPVAQEVQQSHEQLQMQQIQAQMQAQQLQAQQLKAQAQLQAQQLQAQLQTQQLQAQLQAQQLQAQQVQAQLQARQLQAQQAQAKTQTQQIQVQPVIQSVVTQPVVSTTQAQLPRLTTSLQGSASTETLTPVQVVSQQTSVASESIKSSLVAILGDVTRSGTPALLNANVVSVSNDIFNQTYLQDYPSLGSSIYSAIKNFYNNRTPSSYGDTQILLKNAQDKAFLTSSQNDDIKNCLMQVREDVKSSLKAILDDPAKSGTPALLNANLIDVSSTSDSLSINLIPSFNQSYLQNYPSASNSIYTAIQNFYNKRGLYPLGDIQMLLTNAQNKGFLTSSQKSDIKSWGGRLIDEVKSSLTAILKDKTKSGTPGLLNTNVVAHPTGMFNQSYLQNYPSSSNSIYTAIKNFYNSRTDSTLSDLKELLNNAMNKSFVSYEQNSDIANWLMQVGIDVEVANKASAIKIAEMTRVNNILSGFTSANILSGVTAANSNVVLANSSYDSQLSALQGLAKSVPANAEFDYKQYQPSFWLALTNLHKARPKPDKAKLAVLKNWYSDATLKTSKLVASDKNFTTMINDIDLDFKKIDQALAQFAEMTRVNNILSNFTVSTSTYDSQLSILPNLVTSIAGNFQANQALDYTAVQASFWTALTGLHKARPVSDKTKLTTLKTWYTTLNTWYATLVASKLIATDRNFTTMINDINSDLKKIDQALVQSAEMTRVNNILKNFTVSTSTYDSQLSILPNLVTSVAANFQTNQALDYTSVQTSFWTALTSLHNARPKTDKTKLTTLKTWYETLNTWYATLAASKLVAVDKNFTTMINDINSDFANLVASAEMTRVNNILSNFKVTTLTYDSQLPILPNLVTSVASAFQANQALDYTPEQASFWTALTSLHNARPKTDKTKLTTLKAWYETLTNWYATLSASKLVAADKNFTTMISDINADLLAIELARVTKILTNFTVIASTYDAQLLVLQNLVTSVATNASSNPTLVYTTVQTSFWTALTNLHNARPKTDKTKLESLKAWYANTTLTKSKLVATGKTFTTMISDISADLKLIV
ncbi:MAG: hypothetical protein WC192_01875 [Candidatus Babeliales bacterium]